MMVAFALAGSPAWAREPGPDYRLPESGNKGAVVFAMRMPDMDGFNTQYALTRFFMRPVGGGLFSGEQINFYKKMLFHKEVPSDYEDCFGVLKLMELPAGDYVFASWDFPVGGGIYTPEGIGNLAFTVTAGEVTYLGSFDVEAVRGDNVVGMEIAVDPWVEVSNQSGRDLAVLARKFPNIPESQVRVVPLDPAPWSRKPDPRFQPGN